MMMPDRRELVKAKAQGFIQSIRQLGEKERRSIPHGEFGRDYNILREAAAQLLGGDSDLLPPNVKVEQSLTPGHEYTVQSYAEILTYCEQIFQLLSTPRE
jgi:hypothetical protein